MWIITFDGDLPYCGVACDRAGVELGKYYPTKEAAMADYKKVQRRSQLKLRVTKYAQ